MTIDTGILILISLLLLYVVLKPKINRCLWYWDTIGYCWRTQCKREPRFTGHSKEDVRRLQNKSCPFCKKNIVI